jgi:SAM-dependent methyltransferase
METLSFYNELADVYHLVYADWEQSMARQASVLDSIIREHLGTETKSLLDTSCGIGTQSLGLAQRGYVVTGSDISPSAIKRAQREAEKRTVRIAFTIADMRKCDEANAGQFDVVLSADNSIPHLLTDQDIRIAFQAMFRSTRVGGLVIITVRDYGREDRTPVQLRPYGVRHTAEGRVIVFQLWEFEQGTDLYDLCMYFVIEPTDGSRRVIASKARYYAVPITTLCSLLEEAGFTNVERIDDRFFQPVLVGRKTG